MQEQTVYLLSATIPFMRSHEKYGELSNMTLGMPVHSNGLYFQASEGLYQAMKFPTDPAHQRNIANTPSAMTAKKIAKTKEITAVSWNTLRIHAMMAALATKAAQNPSFVTTLRQTNIELPILEKSYRDTFWGAKPDPSEVTATGINMLGQLLTVLRNQLIKDDLETALTAYTANVRTDLLIINHLPWRIEYDGARVSSI